MPFEEAQIIDQAGKAPATVASEPLRVRLEDVAAAEHEAAHDRFHRFKLIGWWDQKKLAAAKVLVVGAGALGNEIVKNLALLGVGHVLIVDMDQIENSNLSRSILYRASDNGRFKADVAAEAAADVYPQIKVRACNCNVVYDLGMGVFRWADVVIGGLDNREARLSMNRACWKVNRPWIDGAIEQIQGSARVFVPGKRNGDSSEDGPCYECTMSATDWKLLQMRRSCNLLSRSEMQEGKTPTTPTISSIIAGVQCQEAVKLLHGLETIAGKAWVFNGMSADSYLVEFQRKPDCYSHETLDEIIPLEAGAATVTLAELLEHARELVGSDAELELGRDVLEKLVCPECGQTERLFASLGKIKSEAAVCPHCFSKYGGNANLPPQRQVRREVVTFHKIRGDEDFLSRTPAEIGIPPFDILVARSPKHSRAMGLELAGDANQVLGPQLAGDCNTLEWS